MNDTEVRTVVINNKKYAAFIVIFCFGVAGIGMFLSIRTLSFVYGAVGIIAAIFIPFIFEKGFRRDFTKTAILQFGNDKFSIDLLNIRSQQLEQHNEFKYSEIKFFKAADSTKDDSAFLKLYLRDGRFFLYTFLEQGKGNGDMDIVEAFPKYFHGYNENQTEENQIQAIPLFLGTRKAKYYLIGLTVLLIAAIIIQIIYAPNAIPGTLVSGGFFYLLILLQRKRDIGQYKKMK